MDKFHWILLGIILVMAFYIDWLRKKLREAQDPLIKETFQNPINLFIGGEYHDASNAPFHRKIIYIKKIEGSKALVQMGAQSIDFEGIKPHSTFWALIGNCQNIQEGLYYCLTWMDYEWGTQPRKKIDFNDPTFL